MLEAEQDILEQARAGDTGAFEKIYRAYSGMVYGLALRMTGREEDAEEVTQDVFVAAHRNLGGFIGTASLKTWFYRITVNTALNAIKRNKRRRSEFRMEEGVEFEDVRNDVSESVERESQEAEAAEMLARLNPDQKACLLLRAKEGLSYEEIAGVLKVNINTVRTRLKRAREALLVFRRRRG